MYVEFFFVLYMWMVGRFCWEKILLKKRRRLFCFKYVCLILGDCFVESVLVLFCLFSKLGFLYLNFVVYILELCGFFFNYIFF